MRKLEYQTDLCVVGGGLAGLCTAISAAREGIKVILIQDRAVLGGNSSSEIRMWVCGSHGKDNRETGIVEELMLENFYFNPSSRYPLWDAALYNKAVEEENLTLLLSSSVLDAKCEGNKIISVTAWQSNAETFHTVCAKYFADCSGDSILAPLSGALYRHGREAKSEFGESIPPKTADSKTMGMSCIFQIRETEHKTLFTPPEWAYKYETDEDLPYKDHFLDNNFWWIEVGGEWDTVHDTDRCRDELIKICYGVWDHMKNKGDHGADNWELEWIGFLPGKRESRRYVGEYTVTENDVLAEGRFFDIIGYAGWSMDDHFPEGFYYKKGYPTIFHPAPQPWGIPFRALISKNIENLTFAGRNISVTHAALSSSRVMSTCGILGEALGTAVAIAVKENTPIREINIKELQNILLQKDLYIPWQRREVSELSKNAYCNSETVRNGIDRGEENCWIGKKGEHLEYKFQKDTEIKSVRIIFDSNLNREEHNMPCCYPLKEERYKTPKTLVREFTLIGTAADGKEYKMENIENHQRFRKIPLDWKVSSIKLIPTATHGDENCRVFSFEAE